MLSNEAKLGLRSCWWLYDQGGGQKEFLERTKILVKKIVLQKVYLKIEANLEENRRTNKFPRNQSEFAEVFRISRADVVSKIGRGTWPRGPRLLFVLEAIQLVLPRDAMLESLIAELTLALVAEFRPGSLGDTGSVRLFGEYMARIVRNRFEYFLSTQDKLDSTVIEEVRSTLKLDESSALRMEARIIKVAELVGEILREYDAGAF